MKPDQEVSSEQLRDSTHDSDRAGLSVDIDMLCPPYDPLQVLIKVYTISRIVNKTNM